AEPGRPVRPAPIAHGRDQAPAQGGHRPPARGPAAVLAGPRDRGDPRIHQLCDHPVRPRGVDLRCPDPAAAHRSLGRRAAGDRDELPGRVRDRAGRLGLVVAVLAARGAALVGSGGQLRDRDEPVLRRGVPVRGVHVHLGDRERAGSRQSVSRGRDNPALPVVVRRSAVPLVHHLPGHDGRGDQPAALRPSRGRGRTGGRLPHRVLFAEVWAVLPGRVHQHGHGVRAGRHLVPRRLARALPDLGVGGRPQRLVAVWGGGSGGGWPLLWFRGRGLILLLGFVWLRGTVPRIGYDQLVGLGWKVLTPASLAWILMIATIRVWRQQGGSTPVYIVGGAILGTLLLLAWAGDVAAEKRRAAAAAATESAAAAPGAAATAPATAVAEAGAGSGGFPVPPLDLPHYHGIGVTASPGGTPSDPDAVPRGTVKEVTGA